MMIIYRTNKLLPKIIILLFGLVLLISFLFLKKTGFLTIQKIEVRTDFQFQNPKKTESLLRSYLDKSFFLNNLGKLSQEIKNQEIKIGQVTIKKEFPGKLILEIKERQPLVVMPKDNLYFFVDKEGIIFSLEKDPRDLPFLEISLQNPKIGSSIEIKRIKIPQILESLKQEKILKIIVKNDRIELETNKGSLIILPMAASDKKIRALQMILNRFRIEGKRLRKIDLRFEKPVISF